MLSASRRRVAFQRKERRVPSGDGTQVSRSCTDSPSQDAVEIGTHLVPLRLGHAGRQVVAPDRDAAGDAEKRFGGAGSTR